MLQKTKRKLRGRELGIIITASVLVFLIIFYIAINAIIGAVGSGEGEGGTTPPTPLEGEALYGNNLIAYPSFAESDVKTFSVAYRDENGLRRNLTMMRSDLDDPFTFYYSDEKGDALVHQPPICSVEKNFDYRSLYATESAEGLNIYRITYMFAAIGALYFSNRIELSENQNERAAQLNRYGLNDAARQALGIVYVDKEGEEQRHTVYIGDRMLTDSGYYFMVDDREYVYTSLGNYLHYAFGGIESFIAPRVVAEGLKQDNAYEPYLTTDYKQWKNRVFTETTDTVSRNSKVIAKADMITPRYDVGIVGGSDGYDRLGYTEMTFDLAGLSGESAFSFLVSALDGKNIGDYSSGKIEATVIANTNEAYVGLKYNYSINQIESVFDSGAEITAEGTAVDGHRYVKVGYSYSITNGTDTLTYINAHAVIDLQDTASAIPAEVIEKLKAAKVGYLTGNNITFEITYTTENTHKSEVEYIISEIVMIYEIDGGTVNYLDKITEASSVSYRYYYMIDGEMYGEVQSNLVDLSKIGEDDEINYPIKQALIGRGVGKGLDLKVMDHTMHVQPMMNFTAYSIEAINYFIVEEMISAFRFVNYSERDPYYGESLYINTLTNKNKSYALNATACEAVVRFLGGINEDTSSSLSVGLVGSETVAVGLTPANMLEYGKTGVGLYANTIYFELPRGIEVVSTGGSDSIDDYRYLDTLGFHLYVSDEMPDGTRYVGSDMYDIIVKIDAAGFEFLERSFVDYWARRSIASVSYSDIEEMTLDLYMEDIYGSYSFDLEHKESWIVDGEAVLEEPENGGTPYDMMVVHASLRSTEATETVFSRLIAEKGQNSIRLSTVYTEAAGADEVLMDKYDTLGTSSFKDMLLLIYSTYYT